MRWNALPIAGLLLLPVTVHADDSIGSGEMLAQAAKPAVMAPAKPAAMPAPAATSQSEMRKYLVFFDWSKATLTPEARKIIADAAAEFKKSGSARLVATGFTDTSGSYAYNMRLSVRRAEAVKAELVRLGVPAAVITTIGRGQNDLLVPTPDNVREAQNRRVSIEFPLPPKVVQAPPPPPPAPVAAPPPPPPPPLKWSAALGPWYGYNFREVDPGSPTKSSQLIGPELRIGYDVAPGWQLYGDIAGWNTIGTSQNDGYGGRGVVGFNHYWELGAWRPFIGPHVGYVAGRGTQDGIVAGPELGTEYNFSRNWYGYARIGYDNNFRNDFGQGIANTGIGAGVRW